jgi:hypothetical protein
MQTPERPDADWHVAPVRTDAPGECNVTGDPAGPFVITDQAVMWGGKFCPSVALVERLATVIGWQPPDGDATEPGDELAALRAEVAELRAEREHWQWLKAAIDLTLKEGLVVTKHRDIKLREPRHWRPSEDPEA